MTVRVLFQWSRFIKLSYDDQVSKNNIFSVSPHWISLIIKHFNLHEERCRAHFSKYCKSYFPATQINGFTYIMSEETVRSFPSCSCSEHFRKYWWKSPYVSNDCLWKLCLYLDFLADFLVDIYEIFNINNSSNLDY